MNKLINERKDHGYYSHYIVNFTATFGGIFTSGNWPAVLDKHSVDLAWLYTWYCARSVYNCDPLGAEAQCRGVRVTECFLIVLRQPVEIGTLKHCIYMVVVKRTVLLPFLLTFL